MDQEVRQAVADDSPAAQEAARKILAALTGGRLAVLGLVSAPRLLPWRAVPPRPL
jgi:hypothetical protein